MYVCVFMCACIYVYGCICGCAMYCMHIIIYGFIIGKSYRIDSYL